MTQYHLVYVIGFFSYYVRTNISKRCLSAFSYCYLTRFHIIYITSQTYIYDRTGLCGHFNFEVHIKCTSNVSLVVRRHIAQLYMYVDTYYNFIT
jgi:hypothetical protein